MTQDFNLLVIAAIIYGSPTVLGPLLTIVVLAVTRSRGWAFGIGSIVGAIFPALLCAGLIWFGMGLARELEMSESEALFAKLLPLILAAPGILLSGLVVGLSALWANRG